MNINGTQIGSPTILKGLNMNNGNSFLSCSPEETEHEYNKWMSPHNPEGIERIIISSEKLI